METAKQAVLSLNNEGFRHYLILRYLVEEEPQKWKQLTNVPKGAIPSSVWYQLYERLKSELEPGGGSVVAYETEGNELKSYEDLNADDWPEHWMWVIKTGNGN